MTSKVAVLRFEPNKPISLKQPLDLIGGISDLNDSRKPVTIKVGVFSHRAEFHTSVSVVDAIIRSFDHAPKILVAESDNYQGTGSERLQVWKELFSDRVTSFNLSEDQNKRQARIADEEVELSHVLFRPHVLVSTHILREYERGSILKNLLGTISDRKKARFHKKMAQTLADVYEAIGGVDLAVMDGTNLWHGLGYMPVRMNTILVGRDAVAVEAIGAVLAGMNPVKLPVLQEFARRRLGEADVKNIEVIGANFEDLKEEFDAAAKAPKKRVPRSKEPTTWGGHAHRAFKVLTQEGFFRPPTKRTMDQIIGALESKSISVKGKEEKIESLLARRVKNGVLRKIKDENGSLYWTE